MGIMKLYNIHDARHGWVGSWEAEPLDYAALVPGDVGRTVIYRRRGFWDGGAGTLTSWRDGIVFARFHRGDTSAACDPADLAFAVRTLDGDPSR
jgi:hypothetical protein